MYTTPPFLPFSPVKSCAKHNIPPLTANTYLCFRRLGHIALICLDSWRGKCLPGTPTPPPATPSNTRSQPASLCLNLHLTSLMVRLENYYPTPEAPHTQAEAHRSLNTRVAALRQVWGVGEGVAPLRCLPARCTDTVADARLPVPPSLAPPRCRPLRIPPPRPLFDLLRICRKLDHTIKIQSVHKSRLVWLRSLSERQPSISTFKMCRANLEDKAKVS